MGFLVHRRAALFVVAAFLFAATAHADQIRLTISFDPPLDSPFANGTLSGSVQFYTQTLSQPSDGNTTFLDSLGTPWRFSGLDAGGIPVTTVNADDFSRGGERVPRPERFQLYVSFNGTVAVAATTSIFPAFAFESLVNPPPDPPQKPPTVLVGTLSPTTASLIASGPIFAFASPGTLVGTWQVEVTPVPEPASLRLLSSGLLGVGLLRRRS